MDSLSLRGRDDKGKLYNVYTCVDFSPSTNIQKVLLNSIVLQMSSDLCMILILWPSHMEL